MSMSREEIFTFFPLFLRELGWQTGQTIASDCQLRGIFVYIAGLTGNRPLCHIILC